MPFLFFFFNKRKAEAFSRLKKRRPILIVGLAESAGGSGAGGQVGNSVFCSDNGAVYAKNTTARRAAIKTERERENSKNKK
jgi:hypothetical protein